MRRKGEDLMKSKLLCWITLVLCLTLAPCILNAESLLISQVNPYLGYGYGLYSWDNMTGDLNTAFGAANITLSGLH